MEDQWGLCEVVEYVIDRGYKHVTLQFPDDLLPQAPGVARALQEELAAVSDAKVYVLADTTYNPLSIDEVAAQHVNADCVIHYGYASLTPVSRTPALCVLPRAPPLNITACAQHLAATLTEHGSSSSSSNDQGGDGVESSSNGWALVTFDQGHSQDMPALQTALAALYQGPLHPVFADVAAVRLDPPAGTANSRGGGEGGCCGGSGIEAAATPTAATGGCCSGPPTGGGCGSGECSSSGRGTCSTHDASFTGPTTASYAPPPLGGLTWRPPAGGSPRPQLFIWIGPPSGPALTHLQLTHPSGPWLCLDPTGGGDDDSCYKLTTGLCDGLDRLLRRRYFLVEKARGAAMLGLLVGTLGAAGYLRALEALRALARQAGKKTYTLLVGKPSPAKLANFPEIEAFVMVAEPQGLVLDSKDYLAPILTPHEAYLALTGRPFDAETYRLDYVSLLVAADGLGIGAGGTIGGISRSGGEFEESEASGSGDEREGGSGNGALVAAGGLQIGAVTAAGAGGRVVARTAAEYLLKAREFKGLETPATGAEVKEAEAAVAGRSGRAAGYADEPGR